MKTGTYPHLEKALLLFFRQQRALGKPISGSLLMEKAHILQEKLAADVESGGCGILARDLECNNVPEGFVNRFKQRHGIRKLKYVGEKTSENIPAAEVFAKQLKEPMLDENLSREQVM